MASDVLNIIWNHWWLPNVLSKHAWFCFIVLPVDVLALGNTVIIKFAFYQQNVHWIVILNDSRIVLSYLLHHFCVNTYTASINVLLAGDNELVESLLFDAVATSGALANWMKVSRDGTANDQASKKYVIFSYDFYNFVFTQIHSTA